MRLTLGRKAGQAIVASTLFNARSALGPESANSDLSATNATAVGLIDYGDIGYYTNISLGTPPQYFLVNIDTGSSVLWVTPDSCSACGAGRGFNESRSKTFADTNTAVNVTYGIGSVAGNWSTDAFGWYSGGSNATNGSNFELSSVTFLLGKTDASMSGQLARQWDGVVGLSFRDGFASTNNPRTLLHTLFSSSLFDNTPRIFSIWLNGSADSTTIDAPNGGELILGAMDASHFTGNLSWLNVSTLPALNSRFYWSAKLDSASFSHPLVVDSTTRKPAANAISPPAGTTTHALFDTGTTVVTVDSATYTTQILPALNSVGAPYGYSPILNATATNGLRFANCTLVSLLPTLNFTFTTNASTPATFSLSPRDYILTDSSQRCYVGILPVNMLSDATTTVWIFGDVFLRRWYSVYDFDKGAIGIAPAANSTGSQFPAASTTAANLPGLYTRTVDHGTPATASVSTEGSKNAATRSHGAAWAVWLAPAVVGAAAVVAALSVL